MLVDDNNGKIITKQAYKGRFALDVFKPKFKANLYYTKPITFCFCLEGYLKWRNYILLILKALMTLNIVHLVAELWMKWINRDRPWQAFDLAIMSSLCRLHNIVDTGLIEHPSLEPLTLYFLLPQCRSIYFSNFLPNQLKMFDRFCFSRFWMGINLLASNKLVSFK